MRKYKLKYVCYGNSAVKMYGLLMIKSDRGWVVELWPCDIYGAQVSDPVEWRDELSWWEAIKLFYRWYKEYRRYVNCPR